MIASSLTTVGDIWVTLGCHILHWPSAAPQTPSPELPCPESRLSSAFPRQGAHGQLLCLRAKRVALLLQARSVKWTAAQGGACPACAATAAPAPTAPTAVSAASARPAALRCPSARCPHAPSHHDPSSCSGACASASTSPLPSREFSLSFIAHQHPRFTWPCSGGSLCTAHWANPGAA